MKQSWNWPRSTVVLDYSASMKKGTVPFSTLPTTSRVLAGKSGATNTGANNVINGIRLKNQLAAEEIAGGHGFQKHVLESVNRKCPQTLDDD